MPESPHVARLQLGRELRRFRKAAGVGTEQAAEELGCLTGKISKVETGKATLRPAEIDRLLDKYNVTGSDRDNVLRLAADARRRSAYRVPDWGKRYVGLEADAAEIRTYQAELVPGLMQTEDYARAVIQAADPGHDPRETERQVAARMERQERMKSGGARLIWAVVNEAVLHRRVGGVEVIRRQLEYLAELNTDPNITIQVLPFSAGAHPAMGSSFVHLRLDEPPEGEIIYLEDITSADYVPNPAQIARYLAVFGRLAQLALDPPNSSRFIREAQAALSE